MRNLMMTATVFLLALAMHMASAQFNLFGSTKKESSEKEIKPAVAAPVLATAPNRPNIGGTWKALGAERVPRNASSSITPVRHPLEHFMIRRNKEMLNRLGSTCKLLFLGDSIVYKLGRNQSLWEPLEKQYSAINLGSPGDKTENILNRLKNGIMRNVTATPLIVLQVGTNNAGVGDTEEFVFNGVSVVVEKLKEVLPGSKLLLLTILPRSTTQLNDIVVKANSKLTSKYTGDSLVTVVDANKAFLTASGEQNKALFLSDLLHPNAQGSALLLQLLASHFVNLPKVDPKLVPAYKSPGGGPRWDNGSGPRNGGKARGVGRGGVRGGGAAAAAAGDAAGNGGGAAPKRAKVTKEAAP